MNLKGPLISVIVPVYNIGKYIEDCLISIRAQTYSNFECLVIDDCGSDNSIEVISKLLSDWNYDKRFKIIRRSSNGGLSAARNTGIDNSIGDYLFFLDGDDKLMPKALESYVLVAQRHNDVQMVQGNVIYENCNEVWQFQSTDFMEYTNDRNWIRSQLLEWKIAISAWNKLYRTDYIKKYKLRFLEGIVHEDVKWCWDNQKHLTAIAFCEYKGYWYRTENQTSIMHSMDKTNSSISFLKIYEQIKLNIDDNKELIFIKNYILNYRTSLYMWSYSKNRSSIRKKLRNLIRMSNYPSLLSRCILLYLLSYLFPYNIYKNIIE